MRHGPVLTCVECDMRSIKYCGEHDGALCAAAQRMLDDDGDVTPDWCPLRASAIAALTERPPVQRTLLSGDYGFDDDGEDPDD